MSERGDRYRYEISWRALITGIIALTFCELLLLSLAIDGLPSSWLWWLLVVVIGLALGLAGWLAAATWHVRPIEIIVFRDRVELPDGLAGTRRRTIRFDELSAIRVVGRSAPIAKTRTREVLYLIHGDSYALAMSELFAGGTEWETFREQVLDRAKLAIPNLRIDIDGKTVNGHAAGDESEADPSDAGAPLDESDTASADGRQPGEPADGELRGPDDVPNA